MKCSFCGNELPNGASFCPECGTILNLDNDFAPPAAPPAPTELPPEPQMQPTEPVQPEAEPEFAVPVYVSPYTAPEVFSDRENVYVQPEPPAPPAETVVTPVEDDSAYEEEDDGDDMVVDGGKKRGRSAIIVILVLVLAAVAAYAVKTFVLDNRPTVSASESQTSTTAPSTQDVFWTSSADTTDDTDDTDDTDVTDDTDTTDDTDDTDDIDDTDVTDDTDEIDDSDLTDPNEFTAPSEFEFTTKPTTTESTTRETTRSSTTTTTRRAVTTTRARVTTTRPRPTTTRPTTTAAPTTTVQRPRTTTPRRTLYVKEDGVALRTAPNKSASSLLSLSVGADVVVTGEENGYYYVYSNRYGVSGWASKAYIVDSRPVAASEQHVSGVVSPDVTYSSPKSKSVAADGSSLNLRKGPDTSYGVIRAVADGYPVLVKGESSSVSGWVYVTDTTHGVSGWVSASFLK